jgi:hypothetical protein
MKWFLALVVALNLLVGAFGVSRRPASINIHAQEVNAAQLKVLPSDWQPRADASAAAVAPVPMASGPLATPAAPAPVVKPLASAPAPHAAQAHPAPPPVAKAAALACVQWPGLSDSELARVETALAPLKLSSAQMSLTKAAASKTTRENVRYWVYYPAQPNPAAAQALSSEMKGKGFDNYVVQNEGEFHGTLSLGLFGREDVAHTLIAKLKAAGYGKAAINERGSRSTQQTSLNFKSLTPAQSQALAGLQKRMTPGLGLKSLSCAP